MIDFQLNTLQVYGVLIVVIFLLDGFKKKGVSRKICDNFLFLSILLFSIFRFDTDPDYLSYVRYFRGISEGNEINTEIAYWMLNSLFSGWKYGFVAVFGVCASFYIYVFHRLYVKLNIVTLGWFFTITLMLLATLNNIVRQSVAMGFFVLAIPYIKEKKLFKVSILLFLGSLMHYSVIVGFVYYFLAQFLKINKISRDVWIVSLCLLCVLSIMGVFQEYTVKLFSLVPKYAHYMEFLHYANRREANSGLGIVLITCIGIVVAIVKNKIDEKYALYVNLALLYFVIYIIFCDTYVMSRIVNYLHVFVIITLAYILKTTSIQWYYKAFIVLACFTWWGRYSYYSSRPYHTILSDHCKNGIYYNRDLTTDTPPRLIKENIEYKY